MVESISSRRLNVHLAASRALLAKGAKTAAIVMMVLATAAAILLAFRWPFKKESVIHTLDRCLSSHAQIKRFHKTFFPVPGYIAEAVAISRPSPAGTVPLASIDRIVCRGSWLALLTAANYVPYMRLESAHIYLPSRIPPPVFIPGKKMETLVSRLIADGAVMEIQRRRHGDIPVRLEFPRLLIEDVSKTKTMRFRSVIRNSEPPAQMEAQGTIGPLNISQLGRTQISGWYHISEMNLEFFRGIAGTLSSAGKFTGALGSAELQGQTFIPDFQVKRSHHPGTLATKYKAVVDSLHGNVSLQFALIRWLESTFYAHGIVSGTTGKTLVLDLDSGSVRVQDLLFMVVRSANPPLQGPIAFHARVTLPPKRNPFLRQVQLDGHFKISGAKFAGIATQQKVDELNARARARKHRRKRNDSAPSTWEADVALRNGTATFPRASFRVPGATALLRGKYHLISEKINLHGTLLMQATLSQAAGGIRSILLKPVDPWFETSSSGSAIPIRITGTYSHPLFKLSLTGSKQH